MLVEPGNTGIGGIEFDLAAQAVRAIDARGRVAADGVGGGGGDLIPALGADGAHDVILHSADAVAAGEGNRGIVWIGRVLTNWASARLPVMSVHVPAATL